VEDEEDEADLADVSREPEKSRRYSPCSFRVNIIRMHGASRYVW